MAIRSSSQQRWLGPGDVAKRLGVSIKTLRVYERAGLIAPDRRESGWRQYGPDQIERLHRVLALKALGLSLAEVRGLIDAPGVNLPAVLDLQARFLSGELAAVRERLDRVRRAQQAIAATGRLETNDLIALSRDHIALRLTSQQVAAYIKGVAAGAGLADSTAHARPDTADETELAAIVAEASRLAAEGCSSAAPEAAELAHRWLVLEAKSSADLDTRAPGVRAFADDLLASRALAPALRFLRATVEHARPTSAIWKGA